MRGKGQKTGLIIKSDKQVKNSDEGHELNCVSLTVKFSANGFLTFSVFFTSSCTLEAGHKIITLTSHFCGRNAFLFSHNDSHSYLVGRVALSCSDERRNTEFLEQMRPRLGEVRS